jgi:ABC-type Fe3+/spermidine/putrescine transport system ATPase subunit
MNRGHIEQVGTPRQIYETPATSFAADFIGKINVIPAIAEGRAAVASARGAHRAHRHPGRHGDEALPAP